MELKSCRLSVKFLFYKNLCLKTSNPTSSERIHVKQNLILFNCLRYLGSHQLACIMGVRLPEFLRPVQKQLAEQDMMISIMNEIVSYGIVEF
jgi:hypothetical protein